MILLFECFLGRRKLMKEPPLHEPCLLCTRAIQVCRLVLQHWLQSCSASLTEKQLGPRTEGFGDCRALHSSFHPMLVTPPAALYIFVAPELRSGQLLTHLAFQKRVQGMQNRLWHILASLPISTSFMWLRVELCCWSKRFVFIYAKTFSSASSVSLSKQFHDVSIQLSHWQCFLIHLAGEAKINFIARSGKNSFRAWNPIR